MEFFKKKLSKQDRTQKKFSHLINDSPVGAKLKSKLKLRPDLEWKLSEQDLISEQAGQSLQIN